MFRPLRKQKKAIAPESTKELLRRARRGVMAMRGDDGYPYAIPLNYWYDEEHRRIYFHGSCKGHKVEALQRCDKVCFTVVGDEAVRDEPWAPYLRSAVVFGRCRPVEDEGAAMASLKQFAMKYYPSEQLVDDEIARAGKAVQMYEIEIEHMTGKEVQER